MKKQFDEDKFVEVIVIPVLIVIMIFIWWLCSIPKAPHYEKIETTTKIVENYVESVENIDEIKDLGTFKITGYTPTCYHCCLKSDGIGSSGRKIEAGKSVAMNQQDMKKHDLKYGDKIYIVGIGERVIEDTGCKQGVIDVACDSHESCYKVTGFYKVERVKVI